MTIAARPAVRPGAALPRTAVALLATLLFVAAGAGASQAAAGWVDLGGGPSSVRVIAVDESRTVLEARLGGFSADPVQIDGATYYRLGLPKEGSADDPGRPALPRLRRSLAIPGDREMSLRILDAEWVDVPDLPVAPGRGAIWRSTDPAGVAYTFDPIYAQAGPYPAEPARLGDPYILRDVRGVVVELNMLQALPAARAVRAYTRLLIEVVPAGPSTRNVLARPPGSRAVDPQFARLYRDHFVNFSPERYTPVIEAGSLLIIAHDAFLPELAPLIEWKLQKGIPTRLVGLSEVGATPEEIYAYVAQAYEAGNLAYLLLVGDAEQVPTFIIYTSGSDPSYALIEGHDSYPEIFVGRFSAETPDQVATQVARTIAYERDLDPGATWLSNACGIASNEGPGQFGEFDHEHMDLIRQDLLRYGYGTVDQIYQPDGTTAMITAALEAGRSVVNYTGHGTAYGWGDPWSGWEVFTIEHVEALQNRGRWPFIDTVGCQAGRFVGQTCFAEAWLRASQDGQPTGAVAAYMSASSQYWVPPMHAQDEFVDLLVADSMRTTGGLWFNGSCRMIDLSGESGELMFKLWILFGDPSLLVRTGTPQRMAVDHGGALALGTASYAVTVPGCAEALCALWAEGVLYGSAYTDTAGRAIIPLDPLPLEPDTLTLTVTAANRATAREAVAVVFSPGPHLVVRDAHLTDAGGDGQADAGERVWLALEVANIGLQAAEEVTAFLATGDTTLTVLVSEMPFPTIPAGGRAWSEGFGQIEVSPLVPDGHLAPLAITLQASGSASWSGSLTLWAHAAAPAVDDLIIADTAGGNADAHVAPGEQAQLVVSVRNEGSGYLRSATATLTCAHPLVAVSSAVATLDLLVPGGTAVLAPPFEIAVDSSYELPYADLRLTICGPGAARRDLEIALPVGGFWEPVEGDVGAWSHGPVTMGFSDQWHVSTEENHTPGGQRAWKCGTPGGSYQGLLDAGLYTPCVELSGFGELRFWMRMDAEVSPVYPGKTHDGGRIEVSLAGGPYAALNPPGGYPYTVLPAGTGPFPMMTPVFSGQMPWQQVRLDLTGLRGPAVFRFRFGSDAEGSGAGWFIDDVEIAGLGSFAGVAADPGGRLALTLRPGGPNPAGSEVRLAFTVPGDGPVRLDLFDAAGRHVLKLFDGHLTRGAHVVAWHGRDARGHLAPSGHYYARLATQGGERSLNVLRLHTGE